MRQPNALFILAAVVVGVVATYLFMALQAIGPTEMALSYDRILHKIAGLEDTAGLKYKGAFHSLLTYPKTIQTIKFDAEDRDLLDGRTLDGLPLVLGLTFQYKLIPGELTDLYYKYETQYKNYERVFKLVGTHIITEQATLFGAYQFFNEKQRIAGVMLKALNDYYSAHMHANVVSLQITEDDLPEAFTASLLEAATTKQKITQTMKDREAKIIEFGTAKIVAGSQAKVTVQKARGIEHQIIQNGGADAKIIQAYVEAEKAAYSHVRTELDIHGADLLHYIWYDSLAGGGFGGQGNGTSVLVGIGGGGL